MLKNLHKIIFISTLLLITVKLVGQDDITIRQADIIEQDDIIQNVVGRMVEAWTENEISEEEIELLVERLYQLADAPISLNSDDLNELTDVQLLTDFQAGTIKKYRRQHGNIQTLWELALLPDFKPDEIESISPFVSVDVTAEKRPLKQRLRYFKHEVLSEYKRTIETADGYRYQDGEPPRYSGSPDKVYFRYSVKSGNTLSAGLTAKKDPGETFFKSPRTDGFDSYVAHAYLNLDGFVKEIFVGDYTVNLGNGLTAGSGLMSGKGSDAINVKNNTTRVRRYMGSREVGFMRGAATTLQYKRFKALAFASYRKIDASIEPNDDSFKIVSLPESGAHRTANELAQRKAAEEGMAGANISYRGEFISVGLNSVALKYNYPYVPEYALYRIHNPNTDLYVNTSLDYQYMQNSVVAWGEVAMDKNRNLAFIQGLQLKTNDIVRLSLLYRHYNAAYYAPLATAFGESSDVSNEAGLYAGISFAPISSVEINAYADLFSFPWMKFSRSSLTEGSDYMVDLGWIPLRNVRLNARVRYKEALYNITTDTLPQQTFGQQATIRTHFQMEIDLSRQWTSKTRVAATFFENSASDSKGWAVIQDLTWEPPQTSLQLSARYAIFNTESYDTRIYAYERDVLYAFSIPALSGIGARYYLVAAWKINRNFTMYAKWAQTAMSNTYEMGSGNDRIDGNARTQFTIKAKVTF